MNRLITKLMVVLMAMFMMMGVVTTPVRAEDTVPEDWFTFEEEEESVQGTMAEAVESVEYLSGTVEAESDNYKVSVSMNEDALIPAGTEVRVTELEEDSDAYKEAKEAVEAEKEAGVEGFAAFDITLYYGEEVIEPSATVTVSVEAKNVPADAENLEIQHLSEKEDDSIVVELVAAEGEETPGTIELNDTQAVAEFDVDGFSTFALTWTNASGEEVSATIRWGTYNGDTFTEMESEETVYLDTSASTISIDNAYEGYYSLGATYYETAGSEGIDIDMTLYKSGEGWQYSHPETNPETGETVHMMEEIAPGSEIRVAYFIPQEGEIHHYGGGDDDIPSPKTIKHVTDNGDGTFKVELTIEGNTAQTDNSHYANVLIILDRTYSMRESMGGGTSKWAGAKNAILTLIDTLTTGANAGNAGKIDFSLAHFGDYQTYGVLTGTWGTTWTKNNTAFRNYISQNSFSYLGNNGGYGTNWEGGMTAGVNATAPNTIPDADPTFVIFITDGDPNCWIGRSGFNNNATTAANNSKDEARTITGRSANLYGVFCGATVGSTSYNRLNDVITGPGQGGIKTIAANDPDTIRNEFAKIAETILDTMGPSDVSVDDGVPSFATVSASVAGEANEFKYEISSDGNNFTEWADAPGASYSQANGVTWDLGEEGTMMAGTWYRLSFNVWPSQYAYDLIADLNNGIKDYDTDLTEVEKGWITGSKEAGYTMKTNTHLNTTYSYNGEVYTDPVTYEIKDMDLPTETISVRKIWKNKLDQRSGQPVQLIVTKDGETYLNDLGKTVVSEDNDWTIDNIYISMGQITVHDGVANVIEPGHDYTIIEPENLEYYWELTADIYHPMVINGVPTKLILDETKTAEDVDNVNVFEINGKFYLKGEGANLIEATNDRRSYLNITKAVAGSGAPEEAKFEFTFKIDNPNGTHPGADYDADNDDFWFSITESADSTTALPNMEVTGATAEVKDGTPTGYWFAQNGSTITVKMQAGWNLRVINLRSGTEYEVEETDTMDPGFVFNNATATAVGADGATPATINGQKATGTIDFANTDYTVKFNNDYLGVFYVYHSSDNTVERIAMTDSRVSRTKDQTTGKYRFTFDIVDEVKEESAGVDYLYGGYYPDYGFKSENYDSIEIEEAEWDENWYTDAEGKPYSYDNIDKTSGTWTDAYTVNGHEAVVEQNKTYYLKEVPTAYILPYTHYTYNKSDKALRNMWYISAIDDLQYNKAGFFVETINADGETEAIVVDTLTVTTTTGGTSVKLSPSSVFGRKVKNADGSITGVKQGYLTYWDSSELIEENATSTFTPFWLTPDNIYVAGTKTRTITFNNGKVGSGGMLIADAANATRFPEID